VHSPWWVIWQKRHFPFASGSSPRPLCLLLLAAPEDDGDGVREGEGEDLRWGCFGVLDLDRDLEGDLEADLEGDRDLDRDLARWGDLDGDLFFGGVLDPVLDLERERDLEGVLEPRRWLGEGDLFGEGVLSCGERGERGVPISRIGWSSSAPV